MKDDILKYVKEEERESFIEEGKGRFVSDGNDLNVVFVPQCAECLQNIDYMSCRKFECKDRKYMKNEEECPYFTTL